MKRLNIEGHEALVDSEDFEVISGFNWRPLVLDGGLIGGLGA